MLTDMYLEEILCQLAKTLEATHKYDCNGYRHMQPIAATMLSRHITQMCIHQLQPFLVAGSIAALAGCKCILHTNSSGHTR